MRREGGVGKEDRRGEEKRKEEGDKERRRRIKSGRSPEGRDAAVASVRYIISMIACKADQPSCQGRIADQSGDIESPVCNFCGHFPPS